MNFCFIKKIILIFSLKITFFKKSFRFTRLGMNIIEIKTLPLKLELYELVVRAKHGEQNLETILLTLLNFFYFVDSTAFPSLLFFSTPFSFIFCSISHLFLRSFLYFFPFLFFLSVLFFFKCSFSLFGHDISVNLLLSDS